MKKLYGLVLIALAVPSLQGGARQDRGAYDDQDHGDEVKTQIAFVSTNGGKYDIFVMNDDGTGRKNLTNDDHWNLEPAFSPDGSKIAFASGRDGSFEIYIMNSDGSRLTRLTNDPALDDQPTFSPDGSQIAFRSKRDGNYEIYVMNVDGTRQTRLTYNASTETYKASHDAEPAFSPDGTKIAFCSYRDDILGRIYIMNADGSDQAQLTDSRMRGNNPTFSPDGSKVAFDFPYELRIVNVDGTGQRRLTNHEERESSPTYSPDGSKIAFVMSWEPGSANWAWNGIYIMNADGTGVTRLSEERTGGDIEPSFPLLPNKN